MSQSLVCKWLSYRICLESELGSDLRGQREEQQQLHRGLSSEVDGAPAGGAGALRLGREVWVGLSPIPLTSREMSGLVQPPHHLPALSLHGSGSLCSAQGGEHCGCSWKCIQGSVLSP